MIKPGMKPRLWRTTKQTGVNVWPNALAWVRDELRSKVMIKRTAYFITNATMKALAANNSKNELQNATTATRSSLW